MVFLKKIQRYNDKVAMAFTQRFYGRVLEFGTLKINVTKNSMNKATRLLLTRERYFIGGSLEWDDCAQFLKPSYKSIKLWKGVL